MGRGVGWGVGGCGTDSDVSKTFSPLNSGEGQNIALHASSSVSTVYFCHSIVCILKSVV